MGLKFVAFVFAIVIGLSHTLPARFDADSDDVEFVNPHRSRGRGFDLEPDRFDFPSDLGFAFPSFPSFQDYFKRLRESIAAAFAGATQGIDLSKGNTTSETKVVDGNLVTINRTVYDDNGVQVVIKNVEVRPVPSGSTPEIATSTTEVPSNAETEDIETFGNSNNEHSRVSRYDNLESFDEVDFDRRNHYQVDNIEEVQGNDIESIEYYDPVQKPYDLSRDTYVNDIMAERGAPRNPDAEEFDVEFLDKECRNSGSIRKRNA